MAHLTRLTALLPRVVTALVSAGSALAAQPAAALEILELRLPLLDTPLVVKLAELRDGQSLLAGSSDLTELDRATDGAIASMILRFFNQPIPLPAGGTLGLKGAVGSPLLHEALLATTALVKIEGIATDLSGEDLSLALSTSEREGTVTLLHLLQALPGQRASVDLGRAALVLGRLHRQQAAAEPLLASRPTVSAAPEQGRSGSFSVQRRDLQLTVNHRSHPLRSVALLPQGTSAKGLVVISHGLWDVPLNFEGWGQHLASHGYAVLLPEHPGSDRAQQAAMLSGAIPPPAPQELGLRPRDISALLDAIAADRLGLGSLPSQQVVVLGHSWGAITAMQLAGLRPSAGRIQRRCGNLDDPDLNVSWILQCSFLETADDAGVADPRVRGVVAVSPPLRLLFDHGASKSMHGRAVVVSGSRDWVVPFGPEALHPFVAVEDIRGHQLVLVEGGTHFNLRPGPQSKNAVLRGLMLTWVQQVLAAGERAQPAPGRSGLLPAEGWGDPDHPLIEATPKRAATAASGLR